MGLLVGVVVVIMLCSNLAHHRILIDLCSEAGSTCNGGQSVINPWFIIGGVASSVCKKSDFIM